MTGPLAVFGSASIRRDRSVLMRSVGGQHIDRDIADRGVLRNAVIEHFDSHCVGVTFAVGEEDPVPNAMPGSASSSSSLKYD